MLNSSSQKVTRQLNTKDINAGCKLSASEVVARSCLFHLFVNGLN